MKLIDRLWGRTGAHRRTREMWAALEERTAELEELLDDSGPWFESADDLIRRLVDERDTNARLARAAAAELEEQRERTRLAEAAATRARTELANARSVSVPAWGGERTVETPRPPIPIRVMTLADAFGGTR
ncbi:hypothetical protein ABIA32_002744 [Streptacidiphilus sp. MAP12-20]|uniref:hypothetical protein n=1 Tax=Streptacidiphilus sp. MAP12-20 TaxID=3156299 RepID=UPI003513A60E